MLDRNPQGSILPVEELVGSAAWASVNELGRPYVVYKFGSTLDGRIAAADGTSQWITGPESRREVQVLRSACDATMVGSGTQQADNPNLAVRPVEDPRLDRQRLTPSHQPLRVVVDSRARTPQGAQILNGNAPTLIAVAEEADARHLEGSVEVLRLPRAAFGLNLHVLLGRLYQRGVRAVFLEGGPTLAGAFVAAGLVDRLVCYLAPALLGAGAAGLGHAGVATIADIKRLQVLHVGRSGDDVRIIAGFAEDGPVRTGGPVRATSEQETT